MSSHHVVREKQEPALYIHRLGKFEEENLGQLLEWSPTLIVNESEYEKLISLGHKVDVIVNSAEQAFTQEHTKTIDVESDELTAVLDYLVAKHYPAVNIIHDDDDASSAVMPFLNQINIVLFNDTYKTYFVKSGFKIWKPSGTLFLINTPEAFDYTNLQKKDSGFEVITDGFVEFAFDTPYLSISEQL